jgi:hypothetical protein
LDGLHDAYASKATLNKFPFLAMHAYKAICKIANGESSQSSGDVIYEVRPLPDKVKLPSGIFWKTYARCAETASQLNAAGELYVQFNEKWNISVKGLFFKLLEHLGPQPFSIAMDCSNHQLYKNRNIDRSIMRIYFLIILYGTSNVMNTKVKEWAETEYPGWQLSAFTHPNSAIAKSMSAVNNTSMDTPTAEAISKIIEGHNA